MNVNKIILLIILPWLSIAQGKKDVYFFLNENNSCFQINTINSGPSDEEIYSNALTFMLTDKEKYNLLKMESEEKGQKFTLNNYKNSSLSFKILSRKKVELNTDNLRIEDFEWLQKNSWKDNKSKGFKNLYFLYRLKDDDYLSFKVEITFFEN